MMKKTMIRGIIMGIVRAGEMGLSVLMGIGQEGGKEDKRRGRRERVVE